MEDVKPCPNRKSSVSPERAPLYARTRHPDDVVVWVMIPSVIALCEDAPGMDGPPEFPVQITSVSSIRPRRFRSV